LCHKINDLRSADLSSNLCSETYGAHFHNATHLELKSVLEISVQREPFNSSTERNQVLTRSNLVLLYWS